MTCNNSRSRYDLTLLAQNSIALVTETNELISYKELIVNVDKISKLLSAEKFNDNERIAILAGNSAAYIFTILAALKLNVPFVPLNIHLNEETLASQLSSANCAVIAGDEHRINKVSSPARKISFTEYDTASKAKQRTQTTIAKDLTFTSDPSEACIIFTSGSSAKPKGVILSKENLFSSAFEISKALSLSDKDRWLLSLSLFHVGGLSILFRAFCRNASVKVTSKYNAETISELLKDKELTAISLVPTVLKSLLADKANAAKMQQLKFILLGGEQISHKLLERCKAERLIVVSSYGLTESSSAIALNKDPKIDNEYVSVGNVLPHASIKVLDKQNKALKSYQRGQLAIKGPACFFNYLCNSKPLVRAEKNYFKTNDIVYLNDNDELHIVGRADRMFISGGENIYPEELELIAESYSGIAQAVVVDVSDSTWGKRPVLFVKHKNNSSFKADDFKAFLLDKLAKYKQPTRIISLCEFPRTSIGKIDYQKLRTLL